MQLHKCMSFLRLLAVAISSLWLICIGWMLEANPGYATRSYLKHEHEGPQNSGIVRMTHINLQTINNRNQSHESNETEQDELFNHFNLMYFEQESLPQCDPGVPKVNILVLNPNNKEIGESYLSLYKQIETSARCRSDIFELNAKGKLIMDSYHYIYEYVNDFLTAIPIIQERIDHKPLTIIGFEEGASIIIQALSIIQFHVLRSFSKIVFINAYNPSLRILYERPSNFIKGVQDKLMRDMERMQILNQTRLLFFSTVGFLDFSRIPQEQKNNYIFVWLGKRLKKTVFINSRLMKTVYTLIDPKDYFLYSNFVNRIVDYLLMDAIKQMTIEQIQMFFYDGMNDLDTFPMPSADYKENCIVKTIYKFQINEILYFQFDCAVIRFQKGLKLGKRAFLFIGPKKTVLLNKLGKKIDVSYSRHTKNYFIVEQIDDESEFMFFNQDKIEALVSLSPIYSPSSNPIRSDFYNLIRTHISVLGEEDRFEKQMGYFSHSHKLVKVCPTGNLLLFPEHYSLYFQRTGKSGVIINEFFNIMVTFYEHVPRKVYHQNCYPDLISESVGILHLFRHRTEYLQIAFWACFFSYISRKQIGMNLAIFFLIITCHQFLLENNNLYIINVTILCLCICLEFAISVAVFLAGFVQEVFELKYRKFMVIAVLSFALLLHLVRIELGLIVSTLSIWKLICICLVFVVNGKNLFLIVSKIYFMADHIVYNHSNILQIVTLLLWIFVTLDSPTTITTPEPVETKEVKSKKKNEKKILDKQQKQMQCRKIDIIFACIFCYLISHPSYLFNICISAYIYVQVVQFVLKIINQRYKK